MKRWVLGALSLLLPACALAPGHVASAAQPRLHARGTAQPGSFVTETYQDRTYKLYLPSHYQSNAAIPLVVMLHGCTQDPDTFATGTQMNTLADQQGFAVIYPEQPASAHPNRCWRWFDPADQGRDQGEPGAINGMVKQVEGQYAIDSRAVYVAGLSAGAAMTAILGATYPDTFAALGICSGLEYLAASNESNAWTAMNTGGPDPKSLAGKVVQAMGDRAHVMPVMVFHGTGDTVVNPTNAKQIVAEWAAADDLIAGDTTLGSETPETTSDQVPNGRHYTRSIYRNRSGQDILQQILVDQMPHAWSGGQSQGSSYMDPQGPSASAMLWDFFKAHRHS